MKKISFLLTFLLFGLTAYGADEHDYSDRGPPSLCAKGCENKDDQDKIKACLKASFKNGESRVKAHEQCDCKCRKDKESLDDKKGKDKGELTPEEKANFGKFRDCLTKGANKVSDSCAHKEKKN